jgi:hypothetical protein
MTYNNLPTQGQPPFFQDDMANNGNLEFYPSDGLMDIHDAWMTNIHPLLRDQGQTSQQQQQLKNQQQPLQRFLGQPERAFFTTPSLPAPSQGYPLSFPRHSAPISTLPQAPRARVASPALSHEYTSTCSSAQSPVIEHEWYQENNYYSPRSQEDFSLPNATSQLSQGFSDHWNGTSQQQAFPQVSGQSYVNMNQVQGFADLDPQEVTYDNDDEGYLDMEMKSTYAIEVDGSHLKAESGDHSYRYSTDEGIGASIKDAASPHNSTSIHVETDAISDADADADADADIEDIPVEAHSDTDYIPSSKTRPSRKRRASNSRVSPLANKRSRVTKSLPKSKGALTCKQCEHAPFKDSALLQRHIASSHTRAFLCVFSFAGCNSTFASKNEWKRHVSSQHLNLTCWVCELGACAKVRSKDAHGHAVIKGSEFNRKDLFTQHLRRMHAPPQVKFKGKKVVEWEDQLKALQASCLRVKRESPDRLACPVGGCGTVFEGKSAWDERMEHVGRHLEKAAGDVNEVRQENDSLLVGWALREGIIEKRVGGGYKLLSGVGASKGEDMDAEGEDE